MNNEPIISFIFKTGLASFLGFMIATTYDIGTLIYNSIIEKQTCNIKYKKKTSTGYVYSWQIRKKDTQAGSIFIYPKKDIGILLEKVGINKENSKYVLKPEEIGVSLDGKIARGLLFKYIPGKKKIIVKFETISNELLDFKKLEDNSCENQLLNF